MDISDSFTMEDDPNNNGIGGGCLKKEKTASEMRKSNKPLMERKRRERINNCLQQLKSILMEVTKKESSYYSKLEKADILEMTVKYLKNMKRQQLAVAMTSDPTVLGKYIAGYNECTTEITKYLNSVDGLNTDTRARLLSHLANSLQRNSISMAANTAVSNLQLSMNQSCGSAQPLGIQIPGATQLSALPGTGGVCVLNQTNQAIQAIPASAMQLVPAKLPTGELVFLLANQQAVSPQGNGVSVVSTVQNNVNNININPNIQSQVTTQASPAVSISGLGSVVCPTTLGALAQTQLTIPANVSTMSPILLTSKTLESPTNSMVHSGASTSGSSPESDISEASSTLNNTARAMQRSYTETPHRPRRDMPRNIPVCSAESESSSDSDNNDDEAINNIDYREASVIQGPMWRPW